MNTIKELLFTGWSFRRILRMAAGSFFLIWGIVKSDYLLILGGAFFMFTALAKAGCCGSAGCSVPRQKIKEKNSEEIAYEEIKGE